MPPNPRDGHRLTADGKVRLSGSFGVREVVADALRPILAHPEHRA